MSPTPSRQALRHLERLVHETPIPTRCRRRHLSYKVRITSSYPSQHRQNSDLHCPSQFPLSPSPQNVSIRHLSTTPSLRFSPRSPANAQSPSHSSNEPDTRRSTPALPDITNYYTLFPSTIPNGPPPPNTHKQNTDSSSSSSPSSSSSSTFSIPLPTLRKEFLRLQSQHHPDKYDPATPAHQKALALSSLINNAYKTLSDPLLRAQYLLQLSYDIDVTSEDNAAHPTDQETLMEVMDAQERIEEAETREDIEGLMIENTQRIQETIEKMSGAFERGDVDAAKSECVRLKYWNSLQEGLNDWEPGKEVRLIH